MSIIVAYAKAEDARRIRTLLVRSGLDVAAVTTSGAQALAQAEMLETGVIVCGYRLRDMLYRELAEDAPSGFRILVITSPVHLDEAVRMDNVLFLTTPVKTYELLQTLERMEIPGPRRRRGLSSGFFRDEKEKESIEKAKAVLMERNSMTEPEAHRYLQKCAMDSGNKMTEAAEMILLLAGRAEHNKI